VGRRGSLDAVEKGNISVAPGGIVTILTELCGTASNLRKGNQCSVQPMPDA
jgi:hypothetical protein